MENSWPNLIWWWTCCLADHHFFLVPPKIRQTHRLDLKISPWNGGETPKWSQNWHFCHIFSGETNGFRVPCFRKTWKTPNFGCGLPARCGMEVFQPGIRSPYGRKSHWSSFSQGKYGFVWKCWVYSQWNSHLIGIMISKTIGFRGTLFSDTPIWPIGVSTIFRQHHCDCFLP